MNESRSQTPRSSAPQARASSSAAQSPLTIPVHLPRRIHMLGIGGAGLSGAARILKERGHVVSGYDRSHSSTLEPLLRSGFDVRTGDSKAAQLPHDAQLLVRTAAIGEQDPQVQEALRRGIPVLKYAELLPRLAEPRHTLAIAGTHGKTTTSWMLLHALDACASAAGTSAPGALIGGICRRRETNALPGGKGAPFVVEACEYDRSFLQLEPRAAAITNVDADHLDYYGSLDAIEEAFARFADRVHPDGLLVLGRNVPDRVESAANARCLRLGREFDLVLEGFAQGCARLRVRGPGWASPSFQLAVPGDFNAENAALAYALAVSSEGVPDEKRLEAAARGLAHFLGVQRRFEPWGSAAGVELVHDYAHHPTELRATLQAARRRNPSADLHVLFQPHQHSRTSRFLEEFARELAGATRVVVAEVYGARSHIDAAHQAGAGELVQRINALGGHAFEGGAPTAAVKVYAHGLTSGALGLVVGAGDIEGVREDLLRELALCGAGARGSLA